MEGKGLGSIRVRELQAGRGPARRPSALPTLAALALCGLATAARAQDTDTVKTKAGVPLKVVVRRDTSVRAEPDAASPGQPVKMFEFFYVLPPERGKTPAGPPLLNNFFRVATSQSEQSQYGWVHKDDVVEWSHRQAMGLRPPGGASWPSSTARSASSGRRTRAVRSSR